MRFVSFMLALLLLASCSGQPAADTDLAVSDSPSPTDAFDYTDLREQMVHEGIIDWGITNQAVIDVMGKVPRHEFVPDVFLDQAYLNTPLPIGHGQTISQPYIVALMTQELNLKEGAKVLEIGTGSGYQAAVLAEMGYEVFTMEIIPELEGESTERLVRLGYTSIRTRNADGYYGWEEEAPFEGIIVTAAPDHVPQPLIEQLASGGVMVIPVGPVGGYQELWKIRHEEDGTISAQSLGGVRFVPLVSEREGSIYEIPPE